MRYNWSLPFLTGSNKFKGIEDIDSILKDMVGFVIFTPNVLFIPQRKENIDQWTCENDSNTSDFTKY